MRLHSCASGDVMRGIGRQTTARGFYGDLKVMERKGCDVVEGVVMDWAWYWLTG